MQVVSNTLKWTYHYAYSKSTGRHCCLWCTIPYSEIKVPLDQSGTIPQRFIETIRQDHENFLNEGKGDIKKAKLYNNCIAEPLVDISLEKVAFMQL